MLTSTENEQGLAVEVSSDHFASAEAQIDSIVFEDVPLNGLIARKAMLITPEEFEEKFPNEFSQREHTEYKAVLIFYKE